MLMIVCIRFVSFLLMFLRNLMPKILIKARIAVFF